MYTFEKGKAYYANPTIDGAKKIIVACTGHDGTVATFSRVGELTRAKISRYDGRETVLLKCDDGFDYFVSSTVEADVEKAAEVMAALGAK